MTEYTYALVVAGVDLDSDDVVDRLAEHHEVVLLSSSDGVSMVHLSIEADTPEMAAWAGIDLVERVIAGSAAERIDLDLVAAADIADRADVSRQAVNQWAGGRRSGDPFPPVLGVVAHGTRVWSWSQVYPWLVAHGHAPDDMPPLPLDAITMVNATLAEPRPTSRNSVRSGEWYRPELRTSSSTTFEATVGAQPVLHFEVSADGDFGLAA